MLHGISHEGARYRIRKDGSRLVRTMEAELAAGLLPHITIPFRQQEPGDFQEYLGLFFWICGRLRDRGHDVRIETRRSKSGRRVRHRTEEEPMTVTAAHRDQLARIRERTHQARAARQRARTTLDAARQAHDQDAEAVASLALDAAQVELETAEQLESMLLSSMADVSDNGHFGGGIFDDPETDPDARSGWATAASRSVRSTSGPVSTREELVAADQLGELGPAEAVGGNGRCERPGLSAARDLLRRGAAAPPSPVAARHHPVEPDGWPLVRLHAGGRLVGRRGRDQPRARSSPPPTCTLTEAEVVAATIAVWTKMKRQQLADTPSLAQTINDRLVYQCLRRLENQVVAR